MSKANQQNYWDSIADVYQELTRISCDDFHYGPLLPGDSTLNLLPSDVTGKQCLELACGAGQNSIFLSKQGAICTAIDISSEQLRIAKTLATDENADITFHQGALDDLQTLPLATYDIVHSSFGLPFAEDPGACIAYIATNLLNPGGQLLISLAHPVSAGEWLEVDDDGEGMFLTNYFDPPADIRDADDGDFAFSKSYPISTCVNWIVSAGLELTALLEPVPDCENTPYFSEGWDACRDQLSCIPIVLILRARKAV